MSAAPAPRLWPVLLLFAGEVLALSTFNAPHERLTRYLYNDSGADLSIPALVSRGLRPTVDFGYIYGLAPLAIDAAWQSVAGANPTAARLAALACQLLMAWGLARFVREARVGAVGTALIVLAMPDLMLSSMVVLVHALEPALLVHALAFQARGRRGAALALATADLFVKPSMAYLYGLLLLIAIVAERPGRARLARTLAPAVATAAVLAVGLGLWFGFGPLVHTLSPGAGLEVYRQNHYGFFHGVGRDFWLLPGATPRDYLRYEVGAWLVGSVVLLLGGVAGLVRLVRRRDPERRTAVAEVVVTCAGLHAGFVALFFGSRTSWMYYYVVLVAGLAAMDAPRISTGRPWRGRLGWSAWQAAAVGLVALLTAVGGKAKLETTVQLWRTDTPSASTFGLWASPAERDEWLTVLRMCLEEAARGEGKPVLLARVEGAAVLAPSVFAPPQTAYLVAGHALGPELERKARQIEQASLVVRVRPRSDPDRGGYERWPTLARALRDFGPAWEGEFFEVDRRIPEPGAAEHETTDVDSRNRARRPPSQRPAGPLRPEPRSNRILNEASLSWTRRPNEQS